MIKRRLYHLNRYREIATALAKHGFGFILHDVGLLHVLSLPRRLSADREKGDVKSRGERIRHVMEELGPTFIKLGQLLSLRPDLIPDYLINELEKLQDDVPFFPYEEAKEIIESELEGSIEDLFHEFDETPLAAASIGQVYRARLKTGEQVVVKLRRPQILNTVETDLEILKDIAQLTEDHYDWAKRYQVTDIVNELAKSLRNELNYAFEARNMAKTRNQFKNNENVIVPQVYWHYSTERILTSEFIDGYKFNDMHRWPDTIERKEVADTLVRSFLNQVLYEGFFHGDPHPGNLFFLPGNKVAFIDFGQVGSLSEEMRFHFSTLVIALMKQSTESTIQAIKDMSIVPDDVDEQQLRVDVDLLREKYYDTPFAQISLGEAVNDLFQVANFHGIHIPKDYTIMAKGMLTIESIAEELNPDLSIIELAEPYGKHLLKERYLPHNVAKRWWDEASQYKDLLLTLPVQVRDVLKKTDEGQLRFEMTLPDLNVLLRKMDRISNRISFSVTLLAFSIIVLGLIVGTTFGHEGSFLAAIPAIEIGFIVATLMFVLLIFSIIRSGRF